MARTAPSGVSYIFKKCLSHCNWWSTREDEIVWSVSFAVLLLHPQSCQSLKALWISMGLSQAPVCSSSFMSHHSLLSPTCYAKSLNLSDPLNTSCRLLPWCVSLMHSSKFLLILEEVVISKMLFWDTLGAPLASIKIAMFICHHCI